MATLPIELLETKLLSPARSRALIPRTDLVERLRAAKGASVITILAAPGFGKTTLLTEWLASDDRSFAWISLDDRDNDPVVFLTYIAVALNKISPIDVGVFEALAAAIPSIEGRVIPRLSAAAAAMDSPIVLVLDDLHTLTEPRCLDALATLLLRLPDTVQVAIAGRGEPALPLPRMRAQGTVLDIGQERSRLQRCRGETSIARSGNRPFRWRGQRPLGLYGGMASWTLFRRVIDEFEESTGQRILLRRRRSLRWRLHPNRVPQPTIAPDHFLPRADLGPGRDERGHMRRDPGRTRIGRHPRITIRGRTFWLSPETARESGTGITICSGTS